MGFDNECILNIQSLAGEYFCPVCRLLVYPNEALQSQCTHLYCKPCLAYVVSTTRACPYDGYLVTEADSKPLTESNKGLAETIGKTLVHCLYHRSGCPWQGPLSDCNSHCSSCVFGNSPVVCNRCAIQIVHRQVQEHAQSCPGSQPQAQPVEGGQDVSTSNAAATSANTEQTQASKPPVVPSSQPQTSQAAVAPPAGQDPSQQANANPQVQPVALATAPTPEQWYQQYYQQYPGYDPYQNYYPYQQPMQPYQQYPVPVQGQQPQVYSQAQPQAHANFQSQPQVSQPQAYPAQNQVPVAGHVQAVAQPAINPQHQLHAMHPQAPMMSQVVQHAQPYAQAQAQAQPPPVQPHAQQHIQMPQYQQPQPQIPHPPSQIHSRPPQPQSHMQAQPTAQLQPQSLPRPQLPPPPPLNQTQAANPQSQIQNPPAQGVTGHQSYPPQPHQQMQLGAQHPPNMHLQSGPTPQYPGQMQGQFPPQMRPPQSQGVVPNQQQPFPSHGQALSVTSGQQSIHPHAQQPGLQRPVMQPVQQQSVPQQHVQNQQPYPGQPSGTHGHYIQQQNMQPQLRPQGGPPQSLPQNSQTYMVPQQNVPPTHGLPPPPVQNFGARQGMPNQVVQTQHFPQPTAGFASAPQARPMQPGMNQPVANQSYPVGTSSQLQASSEKQTVQSAMTSNHRVLEQPEGSIGDRKDDSSSHGIVKKEPNSLVTASGVGTDGVQERNIKSGADLKSIDGDSKVDLQGKDTDSGLRPDSAAKHTNEKENKQGSPCRNVVEVVKTGDEAGPELIKRGEHSAGDGKLPKDAIDSADKNSHSSRERNLTQSAQGPGADDLKSFSSQGQEPGKNFMHHAAFPPMDHMMSQHTPMGYGPSYHEQRPAGAQPAFPPGPPNHAHAPGQHPSTLRPRGPGGIQGPNVASFERPPNHFGPGERSSESVPVAPPGYYNQGPPSGSFNSLGGIPGRTAPHGPEGNIGRQLPPVYSNESDMLGQRSRHLDGRQHDHHFDGSLERAPFGQPPSAESNMMRMNGPPGDMRFKHGMEEGPHRFQMETGRRVDRGELEEDLKQFPRHSHLDNDSSEKFDSFFSSSKPMERGPHGEPGAGGGPRFMPPFHHGGPVDAGSRLRPVGPDGNIARADNTHPHPDFLGPARGFGRHNMDRLPPRSPGREYFGGPGIPPHQSGPHDIDGRESRPFGEGSRSFNFSSDPFGSSFEESRFPPLPGHLRRGEFDGPGNMRGGDLVGPDVPPNQQRRGDFMGPRNLSSHMPFGEPAGFGGFPGHPLPGDPAGPGSFQRSLPYGEPFGNKSGHPRLGEPGFRSSYSLAGGLDPFDNSRKRKATSMGWCRICKVDCETVEGLDMHSQTREHQKMAMDMVISIKQQNKKQRTSKEHPSFEEPSKLRGSSYEVRGNKP